MSLTELSQADIQRFGANPKETFSHNLTLVHEKIELACQKAGRKRSEVRLLPITKTVPSHILRFAYEIGLRDFGENKIQEAKEKSQSLSDLNINWCIVGHLQSNKIKQLTSISNEFHALDSLKLAELMNKQLEINNQFLDVFIQVNTSNEDSKYGLNPNEVNTFIKSLDQFPRLRPKGLMTLAMMSEDDIKVRECFKLLKKLRDEVNLINPHIVELSMGMSGDYEQAILEGATVVRVGQAIFGKRPTPNDHYWPTNNDKN